MRISRRTFAKLGEATGAVTLLGLPIKPVFADAPITAQQIADRVLAIMGPAWNPASYRDTFKMGDPHTPVNGVAACFMSTLDVLKRPECRTIRYTN